LPRTSPLSSDELDAPRKTARANRFREMDVQDATERASSRGRFDITSMRETDRARQTWSRERDPAQPWLALDDHARDNRDAEAGFDETEHGVELTSFDRDPRLDPLPAARGQRHLTQVVTLTKHHQRMARQVAYAHRRGA